MKNKKTHTDELQEFIDDISLLGWFVVAFILAGSIFFTIAEHL